jgi:hypothetical protein
VYLLASQHDGKSFMNIPPADSIQTPGRAGGFYQASKGADAATPFSVFSAASCSKTFRPSFDNQQPDAFANI